MDRNEAVLRELNLYPQWVRREQPAAAAPVGRLGGGVADTQHVAQPVPSSDEGRNPSFASDMPVEAVVEPAAAVAGDEAGREQLIARLGWPELKTMVRDCTACKLRAGCTQTVFGVGDQQADWLFVGEGPGADEDARGEPFVGQAGKLLDSMLLALKLKRGDNVYIANIVKCRPPGNRTPEADEIATCLPYLQRQIRLIQPKVIVALGKTAATALLNTGDVTLGSLRGTAHEFELASAIGEGEAQGGESSRQTPLMELPATRLDEQTAPVKSLVVPHRTTSSHRVGTSIPLIVTYHPAYLLRSPLEKAKAWQDLCLARQKYSL